MSKLVQCDTFSFHCSDTVGWAQEWRSACKKFRCWYVSGDGGLLRLHEADEAAVDWLTTYGSEHTIIIIIIISGDD